MHKLNQLSFSSLYSPVPNNSLPPRLWIVCFVGPLPLPPPPPSPPLLFELSFFLKRKDTKHQKSKWRANVGFLFIRMFKSFECYIWYISICRTRLLLRYPRPPLPLLFGIGEYMQSVTLVSNLNPLNASVALI